MFFYYDNYSSNSMFLYMFLGGWVSLGVGCSLASGRFAPKQLP